LGLDGLGSQREAREAVAATGSPGAAGGVFSAGRAERLEL
jgi:hypothetical protein